jgi:hypothetical protein
MRESDAVRIRSRRHPLTTISDPPSHSLSVHPGTVNTDMQTQWESAYPGLLGKVLKNLMFAAGRDPEQGAYSALYAALSDEVIEKGWNGWYLSDPVSAAPGCSYLLRRVS